MGWTRGQPGVSRTVQAEDAAATNVITTTLPDGMTLSVVGRLAARHLGKKAQGSWEFGAADNALFASESYRAVGVGTAAVVRAGALDRLTIDDDINTPVLFVLDKDDSYTPGPGEYEVILTGAEDTTGVRNALKTAIDLAIADEVLLLTTSVSGSNVVLSKTVSGVGGDTGSATWAAGGDVAFAGGAFAGGSNGTAFVMDDAVHTAVSFYMSTTPTSFVTPGTIIDGSGVGSFADVVTLLAAAVATKKAASLLALSTAISGGGTLLTITNDNYGTAGNGAGKLVAHASVTEVAMAGGTARDSTKDAEFVVSAGFAVDSGTPVQLEATGAAGTTSVSKHPAGTSTATYLSTSGANALLVFTGVARDVYSVRGSLDVR